VKREERLLAYMTFLSTARETALESYLYINKNRAETSSFYLYKYHLIVEICTVSRKDFVAF